MNKGSYDRANKIYAELDWLEEWYQKTKGLLEKMYQCYEYNVEVIVERQNEEQSKICFISDLETRHYHAIEDKELGEKIFVMARKRVEDRLKILKSELEKL